MLKLVKIAPWLVGIVLVFSGMKHFGINLKDLLDLVNDKSQQFSQDAQALANGAATARIKAEYQSKNIEIEAPRTAGMDEETKQMAQELHAAREEMLEQRRQAVEQRLSNLSK